MFEGLVLYQDLLGGKALLDSADEELVSWLSYVEDVLPLWINSSWENVGFFRFSDNFAIAVHASSTEEYTAGFHALQQISSWFHVTALTRRLQYRGVIARGQVVTLPSRDGNGRLMPASEATNITGLALGIAHEYERVAGWGRTVVHPSALEIAKTSDAAIDFDGATMIDFAARIVSGQTEMERLGSPDVISFVQSGLNHNSQDVVSKFELLLHYMEDRGLSTLARAYRKPILDLAT